MNRPLYNQLVEYYEIVEGRDWQAEVDLLAFILQGRKCKSVTDLGCGTGFHVRALTKRGFRAIGIDVSKQNIMHAKRKARQEGIRASFVVASYYKFRPREPFDAAICLNWSIPVRDNEVKRFLDNTYELLAPRGILIFDYERASQIVRGDVGRVITESWNLNDDVIVRSSVGQLESNVLFSRDVYLIYPNASRRTPPSERMRYDASKHSNDVQVYCDISCVRFFSIPEIRIKSRNSGFRMISNFVLPRKKYKRNYAVLQKE
jgi:SAM-dependent methyltransferase